MRPTPWMAELEEQLAGIDELRLVTLDNAALLYADNENDRIAVTGFLNRLNGMAARLGAAVLLSTHASKSKDGSALRVASGSTAWLNAARGVIGLEPERDGEPATLKVVKANHSQPGEEVRLEWRSGVLMARDDTTGIVGSIRRSTCERVFLEILRRVTNEGRHVSDAKAANNFAPRLFGKRPERDGFTKVDFDKAMEALFAAGRIKCETYGRPGDNRQHIVAINTATEEDQGP